jgi:amino acid adenylation domain-containing protein
VSGARADRIAALPPERRLLLELLRKEKQAAPAAGEKPPASAPFDLLDPMDRARIPDAVEDAYPLAMLQLGMLYHFQLTIGEAVPAYHNVNSFHLVMPFDAGALERAVQWTVARHPMLRTSFDLTGYGEPLQLVHRSVFLPVPVIDLRAIPLREAREQLHAFHVEENRRVFDLSRAPLMRLHVHRFGERELHLTLTEIHAISEGWSTARTLGEIYAAYRSLLAGGSLPEDPAPSFLYRDFIRLEREALAAEEQRRFWRRKLAGCTVTRLPRWPREMRRDGDVTLRKPRHTLDQTVFDGIRRQAARMQVPYKSFLLAAHLKVLAMLSGQEDVVTGVQTHGRPETADAEKTVGVFINTVPFRFEIRPESWRAMVRRVFDAEVEMIPFRRYPLAALQREWGAEPLLETAFAYLNFHSVEQLYRASDLELSGRFGSDWSVTHFVLHVTFHVLEGRDSLLLLMEHDNAELAPDQVRHIRRSFERVLAAMATHPEGYHDAEGWLAEEERRALLYEWNDTRADYPLDGSLAGLIVAQAARTPAAVALSCEGRTLSYRELSRRTALLALRLRALGAGPDTLVGVAMERSLDLVVALVGILRAGAAYVPLDPEYPRDRLAFMAEETRVAVVLTQGHLAAGLPTNRFQSLCLDDAEDPDLRPAGPEAPPPPAAPESLAYVIYTSGSTGRPKGSMLAHRGIVNRLAWMQEAYRLTPADRVLQKTPISFDVSVWEFFWPLLVGARLVLARPGGHRDPAYLADLIAREGITTLHFVPSLLQVFLDEPGLERCSSLRRVFCSGEALARDLESRFFSLFARWGTELHNLYGPTEASVDVTAWACSPEAEGAAVPIGRPIANTRIHVLDRWLQPVPVGSPGELVIAGVGLARGYLGRPGLTAERFVPNPLGREPGERLYRTGDVARYLPDGALEFLGRLDHQVKIRGLRVELGEIESLLSAIPGIQEAVVVAREDTPGDRRLIAYLVGGAQGVPPPAELRAALRASLPEHMVPAGFITLERLPLTASGKLDRRALPAPQGLRAEAAAAAYLPARNPLEETIAEVWREALHVEKVGIDDNFFDLGGNSLLLLRAQSLLRARLGGRADLMQLFRFPTIRRLSEQLELGGGTPPPPTDAVRGEHRRGAASLQGLRRQEARTARQGPVVRDE